MGFSREPGRSSRLHPRQIAGNVGCRHKKSPGLRVVVVRATCGEAPVDAEVPGGAEGIEPARAGGTALAKATKRGGMGDGKSERLHSTCEAGEPSRGTRWRPAPAGRNRGLGGAGAGHMEP